MFAVTVTFHIHPGQMAAFWPLMVENARRSKEDEPGCHQFDVCRDGDEIFLYEVYDDRAAFDAHLATAHFQGFDAASAEMIASKSVKVFDEVVQ